MGKVNTMLFVLSYDDFKQLAATYVEDTSLVMEALTESFSAEGFAGQKGGSARSDRCGRLVSDIRCPSNALQSQLHPMKDMSWPFMLAL